MKSQQPLAPGGDPDGSSQMVEHITYWPNTEDELVNLVNQFHQRPKEPLAEWLLRLWEVGVDCIMCTDNEMEKLGKRRTHSRHCEQVAVLCTLSANPVGLGHVPGYV